MRKHYTKKHGNVIEINESQIKDHTGKLVGITVDETFNAIIDLKTDNLCNICSA